MLNISKKKMEIWWVGGKKKYNASQRSNSQFNFKNLLLIYSHLLTVTSSYTA